LAPPPVEIADRMCVKAFDEYIILIEFNSPVFNLKAIDG
jgi:hypothetical protein